MLKKSASREKAEVQAKVDDKIKNIRSSLYLNLELSLRRSLRPRWTVFLSILRTVLAPAPFLQSQWHLSTN